jgi:hypothetical protein
MDGIKHGMNEETISGKTIQNTCGVIRVGTFSSGGFNMNVSVYALRVQSTVYSSPAKTD